MANVLYFSNINPVKFYLPSPDTTYHSRHIDDFEFYDSIPEWQDHLEYYQPWQLNNHVYLQLMSDFGPHNIKVLDQDDNMIQVFEFQQIAQDENNPTLWIYELDIDLSVFNEGVYRFQYEGGTDNKLILRSNLQDFCIVHKHSILLAYKHYQYHLGIMFETGIVLEFRVEGANLYKSPASKDEDFEDQTLDESLLSSTPYRIFQLIIGDAKGVPDYVIDIVNRILSCSDVTIDGRKFVKPKDSKWEVNEQDGYPARGWRIDLREGIVRHSRIYDSNQPQNAKVSIAIVADSKGFGLDTGGTNSQILDVQ